jgi:hypothetical protein
MASLATGKYVSELSRNVETFFNLRFFRKLGWIVLPHWRSRRVSAVVGYAQSLGRTAGTLAAILYAQSFG